MLSVCRIYLLGTRSLVQFPGAIKSLLTAHLCSFLAPSKFVLFLDSRFEDFSSFSLSPRFAAVFPGSLVCTWSAGPSLSSVTWGGHGPAPLRPQMVPRLAENGPPCRHCAVVSTSAFVMHAFPQVLTWPGQRRLAPAPRRGFATADGRCRRWAGLPGGVRALEGPGLEGRRVQRALPLRHLL